MRIKYPTAVIRSFIPGNIIRLKLRRMRRAGRRKATESTLLVGEGGFQLKPKQSANFRRIIGEVAEWSMATVLKTVRVKALEGSNPSLSAR